HGYFTGQDMAALGRKNSGLSMHHNHDNKDVAAPIPGFQIVVFPRFVGDSDALCFALWCFANPVPAGPCQAQSTDSIADNSGQFHRKSADFSRNVANVHALATRRRDAFFGLQLKPGTPKSERRRRSSPGAFSAPFLWRTLSTRPRKLRS